MTSLIPDVDAVVENVVEWALGDSAKSTLAVLHGPPTAGKTLALHSLATRLVERGMRVFRISPSPDEEDTCVQILAQLGDQDQRLADLLKDDAGAAGERAQRLHRALAGLGDGRGVALLFDEPRLNDAPQTDPDPLMARAHAGERDMARELTARDGIVRIVAMQTPIPEAKSFALTTRAPTNWLKNPSVWGPLSTEAERLGEKLPASGELRSALHLRLAVALYVLGEPVDGIDDLLRGPSEFVTTALARRVWSQSSDALRGVWGRLAVERRPLDTTRIDDVCRGLDVQQTDLLKRGLLYDVQSNWYMHESVRAIALSYRPLPESHCEAARGYSKNAAQSLVASVEAFHHWLAGERPDEAAKTRILDLDQLNQLGRLLSLQGNFANAVSLFESVLEKRPRDDYAAHYVAYNLDRLGRDPRMVEDRYRYAIKLAPSNVWWHQRYVNFLITQGRDRDARLAWIEALSATQNRANTQDAWYYENLQKRVVELLLARGETEWAGAVLDTVPNQVFELSPALRRLRDRQRAYVEVDRNGAVFPVWVEHSAWWTEPMLLPPRARKGGKEYERAHWWAARVDSLSGGEVVLLYGQAGSDQRPTYARTAVKKRTLEGWLGDEAGEEIEPGRFLEIGFYGPTGKIVRARAHSRTSPVHLDETPEDTARYVRSARSS